VTDAARKRIDVSGDVHARLEAEARRRGIPIRDLVDQAITEKLDRGAQTALGVHQQREQRQADRIEELAALLDTLGKRIGALLQQQVKDLPAALKAGFDATKATIRETGGTGHLRDMISAFEKAFVARFEAANAAGLTAVDAVARTVNARADKLELLIQSIGRDRVSRRASFVRGMAALLALFMLVGFTFRGTPPARWLAVRLVGETSASMAAYTLAGDGRTRGLLMAETSGLLHDRRFRERYEACVDYAKQAKTNFPCRITFPVLRDATP